MSSYYRGRDRIEAFEYDSSASNRYRFIQKFNSLSEVKSKYYSDVIGNYPLFRNNDEYHVLPNGNILTKDRTGRKGIARILAFERSPYVNMRINKFDDKKVECFNLLGEKMCEFKNVSVASKVTGMSISLIYSRLKMKYDRLPSSDDCLIFKYAKDE